MNAASQWRHTIAKRLAPIYAANPHVAAVLVGGSTARGHADRYSDIELGVFWHQPPTDAERFTHKPPDLVQRLTQVYQVEPADGARILAELVEETYDLIEQQMPQIDVARLRAIFRYRRPAWDHTPPTA